MTTIEAKKIVPQNNVLFFAFMAVGVGSFALGLRTDATHTWFSFLLNHLFFLGLGIGAMFMLAIHYITAAGWNVAVRRVPEAMASYLIFAVVFNIVLFFGLKHLFPWTNLEFMRSDEVLKNKIGFFGTTFFVLRNLFFFGVLAFFSMKLLCNSTKQDEKGGLELFNKQKPLSAVFLVLFGPTFTLFTIDWIKSLDPKWFSTIFGVYVFIGFVQSSVAASIIIIRLLQKRGHLSFITADHFHDLGKYLFGFSIFWAYIAVSQYLLIWYANLPDETSFYMARQVPGWVCLSISLPLLRFVIPFLFLLPRMAKRTPSYLQWIALVVLVGEWVDLNWLVMPTFSPAGFHPGWQDIGLFLGFFGFFAFAVSKFFSRHATVAIKDPYLQETLHHHVM